MDPTPEIIIEDIDYALQFVESKLNPSFPIRGAFQSQLYCVIKNRSDVDEGVSRLRNSNEFKLISCKHCGLDDIFIIKLSSYIQDVVFYFTTYLQSITNISSSEYKIKMKATIECKEKYLSFISNTSCMSVNADDLLDNSSKSSIVGTSLSKHTSSSSSSSSSQTALTPSDIELLIKLGFLTARRLRDSVSAGDVYWIAHPQVGRLITAVTSAQSKLVTFIKSRKFKEIGEEELYRLLIYDETKEQGQMSISSTSVSILTSIPTNSNSSSNSSSSSSSSSLKRKRKTDSWGGGNTPQAAAARLACAGLGIRYCILYLEGHSMLLRVRTPSGQCVLRLRE